MSIENSIDLFGADSYYLKLIGFLIGIVIIGIVCFIDDSKGGVHPLIKFAVERIFTVSIKKPPENIWPTWIILTQINLRIKFEVEAKHIC